jgi:hypothetical protein
MAIVVVTLVISVVRVARRSHVVAVYQWLKHILKLAIGSAGEKDAQFLLAVDSRIGPGALPGQTIRDRKAVDVVMGVVGPEAGRHPVRRVIVGHGCIPQCGQRGM